MHTFFPIDWQVINYELWVHIIKIRFKVETKIVSGNKTRKMGA